VKPKSVPKVLRYMNKTIAAQKSGFHLIGNTLLQRSH
jgi:hypothetical protein